MRRLLEVLATILGLLLFAGTLSPLVQANWQAWAQKTGNDQYFIQIADALVSWLASTALQPWFIFLAGFVVGFAACLWLEKIWREPNIAAPSEAATNSADELAYALHPVSSSGMNVVVDKRKGQIQLGFRLKNSSNQALRYTVIDTSAAVEGKTVMSAKFTNRGGVVQRDDIATFQFAPISHTIGKKDVRAEAAIRYQYGPAAADVLPVREANYRTEITISPTAHNYVFVEENDGAI